MESGSFVGRSDELEELVRALHAAAEGAGGTVLVAGEAGIGKTRLASELAVRARGAGFDVLLGRCLDLVGTELPYQPFVEALRPLGELRPVGSQLRLFEDALALVVARAEASPVLLVLEDLHWADPSTLDLVVYLAHNLDRRRALLLATYRPDELESAERMRRLVDAVRRSGSAVVVGLGPLERDELRALLVARAGAPPSPALASAIVSRAEGNPFFAEELLAAAGDEGVMLPRGLRDVLLQRVARLDRRTQGVLRLAAAAGRDVGYALLRAAAELPERDVRESLRRAVEHGVLVADQGTGGFRFRHALLAEAIYATLLPGEREEVHARLADELARGEPPASPAELAPHWAAAGRAAEALSASIVAARDAEAVFGLAEALAHLERALRLWDDVPDAAALAGFDLAELCDRAAQLAMYVGAAPRAVELARRAVELAGEDDATRAALVRSRLGRCLVAAGNLDEGLAERERAVELVGPEPSVARAEVLAALGNTLMLAWRHEESRPVCEEALAVARAVGAGHAEFRSLGVLAIDLAYLGRGEEGLAALRQAMQLAEVSGKPEELMLAHTFLTDLLNMLGRSREAAGVAAEAVEALRPYGIEHGSLVSNGLEALIAIGEWDEADVLSAAAVRAITSIWPHQEFSIRAELETGRGDFASARAHLETAAVTVRKDQRSTWPYDFAAIELALWERRWADAEGLVDEVLTRAHAHDAALIRVQVCAKGLRAQAELAALARARRDDAGLRDRLAAAQTLLDAAVRAADEAASVTPNAAGWRLLAEAEHERACGRASPEAWAEAAAAWDRLDRPPVAAYCRWRQAEALVAAGATRAEAAAPLREAHAAALRLGAQPLVRELELLAERARLELAPPELEPARAREELEEQLGLTPREVEVLGLVARGLTNREIAAELVISVKTANVHVSHILRKLDAPNRREAAAIAHRIAR